MENAVYIDTETGEVTYAPEEPYHEQVRADALAALQAEQNTVAAAADAKAQAVATLQAKLPADVFAAVMSLADNLNA